MIDKNNLNKIMSLDDDTLRKKLSEITALTGADNSKVTNALSDVNKLRKTVSSLSNNDIEKIIASFGRENEEQIQKIISNI